MTPLQVFFDWQRIDLRRRLAQPIQREPRPREVQPVTRRNISPKSLLTADGVSVRMPSARPSTYRKGPAPHGTLTRYTHGKCRCDECRTVHSNYQRAYSNLQNWTGGTV